MNGSLNNNTSNTLLSKSKSIQFDKIGNDYSAKTDLGQYSSKKNKLR